MAYKFQDLIQDVRHIEIINNKFVEYPAFPKSILENWSSQKDSIAKIITNLTPHFDLKNKESIGNYLLLNQFLIPLLEDCYHNIKQYFHDSTLVLEVIFDPMDNEEELLLSIKTDLDIKNALNLLDQFDDEWWVNYSHKVNGKLIIDVES